MERKELVERACEILSELKNQAEKLDDLNEEELLLPLSVEDDAKPMKRHRGEPECVAQIQSVRERWKKRYGSHQKVSKE